MDYMNAKEAADKWGLSVRRVQVLCEQGRVDGVERKAAMVSNLLVVLCGNRDAQPVVNSGSLY